MKKASVILVMQAAVPVENEDGLISKRLISPSQEAKLQSLDKSPRHQTAMAVGAVSEASAI